MICLTAHAQKGWHGATREFPCSRSAHIRSARSTAAMGLVRLSATGEGEFVQVKKT